MKKSLYQIIVDDLRQDIQKGTLPANAKIPTEQELANQYQVSRITSKRALNELEQAGLIYRKQGSGSFVQDQETPFSKKGQPISSVPLNSILYIAISNGNDMTSLSLAASLELQLSQSNLFQPHIIDIKQLTDTLFSPASAKSLVLLIGDNFKEDIVYQLYEKNIPFYQIATKLDPLDRPQIILSLNNAVQSLVSALPEDLQNLYYYEESTASITYDTQSLKIDLLKITRQRPNLSLHLLDETKQPELDALPSHCGLIFNNFYTWLQYSLTHPTDMVPTFLLTFQLTAEQQALLKAQQIPTFLIDSTYLQQVLQRFLLAQKKDATTMQSITVSAKSLVSNHSNDDLNFNV